LSSSDFEPVPFAVFSGLDVDESEHLASALDAIGRRLHDEALPNDEIAPKALFACLADRGALVDHHEHPAVLETGHACAVCEVLANERYEALATFHAAREPPYRGGTGIVSSTSRSQARDPAVRPKAGADPGSASGRVRGGVGMAADDPGEGGAPRTAGAAAPPSGNGVAPPAPTRRPSSGGDRADGGRPPRPRKLNIDTKLYVDRDGTPYSGIVDLSEYGAMAGPRLLGRWLRARPRSILFTVGTLIPVGAAVIALGWVLDAPGGWLEAHGFLTNVIASAGTGALGVAAALLIFSQIVDHGNRERERRDAAAAAGNILAELAALHLRLFPMELRQQLPNDRRRRNLALLRSLDRLRSLVRTMTAETAAARRVLVRNSSGVEERRSEVQTVLARLAEVNTRWGELLTWGSPQLWREMGYTWSLLEQDLRVRLLSAGIWLPRYTVLRTTELLRPPDQAVTGELLYFPDALTLREESSDLGITLRAVSELRDVPKEHEHGMLDGTIDLALDHLRGSLHYLDRLLLLTLQLEELARDYAPPDDSGLPGHSSLLAPGEVVEVDLPRYMIEQDDFLEPWLHGPWSFHADGEESRIGFPAESSDAER
jgi:hypothetical protein